MTKPKQPTRVVIAGPNGAGKSKAAPFLLRQVMGILEFVHADQIAAGLSAYAPETAAFAAGRIMLKRLHGLASSQASFAFESTLSSRTFAPFLARCKSQGYGSVAKQQDTAHSDLDVLIVSPRLGYADAFGALEAVSATLGRKVSPTLYTPSELNKRIAKNNAFVTHVLKQPKIWLIGTEEGLHIASA